MTRTWGNCESGGTLRRYPQVPQYSISHDRYLTPAQSEDNQQSSRGYHSIHDSIQDNDLDEAAKAANRRRIPVACGRCRKRKIRCSGPQGPHGDLGCVNCKNAGNTECQFNRVQSEELPFRDNTIEFNYSRDISSAVQCNLPCRSYVSQASSYPGNSGIMPLNISMAQRSHPLSNYAYQSKSECYIPSYSSDYGDESAEYSIPGGAYSLMPQEQIGMSSVYPRSWSTIPAASGQAVKNPNGSMYFDADTSPAYHALQYQNQHFAMRNLTNTESNNNFSLGNMVSSLPNTSTIPVTERVLPMPSTSRSNSVTGAASGLATLARSADCMPYSTLPIKTSSGIPMIANNLNSMSYATLSTSPSESAPYTSNGLPSAVQVPTADMYAHSSGSESIGWTSENIQSNEPTLRNQNSSSELYYTATSENSRKGSQSGQSTLSNGHIYHVPVPYHQESQVQHTVSRNPSMDMGHVAHRHSNVSLRAA